MTSSNAESLDRDPRFAAEPAREIGAQHAVCGQPAIALVALDGLAGGRARDAIGCEHEAELHEGALRGGDSSARLRRGLRLRLGGRSGLARRRQPPL